MPSLEEVGLRFVADNAGGFVASVESGSKAAKVFGLAVQDTEKRSSSAFDNIARGAQEKIGHVLVDALQTAGQAVVGFVKDGIKGAADFQSSMAIFQTSSGATAEEMEQARQVAKALGADLTLPSTSASDAGQAMTELAKAGLTAKEAMDATRGALQLAAAGNLGNAEAATIAAQALNAFGLEGGQATQVADMLAAASNASALEVRDVAEGFKMASAVFNSFQSPVVGNTNAMYDLTTALSIMANAGIVGSDAGTSLKQTLLQLSGPTDKAKNLMRELAEQLGIEGDLAYDAQGQMRPLRDIVELTTKATAKMTQEQRNYTITTIFGSDAMRSMITLMNAGSKGWDEMRSKVTTASSASDLAAVRMTGLNGAVAGLGSQVETLALEAFTPLLPVLEQGVTAASTFVSSLTPLAGPMITQIVTTITDIATSIGSFSRVVQTGFVPAVYAASAALAIYALVNLPAVIAALPIVIGLLAGSVVGFAAQAAAVVAATGPLLIIAGAIAMVALAWTNYQDQVGAVTQRVLNSNEAWVQGTKVLQDYHQASADIQTTFQGQATELENLRNKQTEQVAAYSQYVAIWGNGTAEAQRQRDAINELGVAITDQTNKLATDIETYKHLHDTDAIEDMRLIRVGFGETTESIRLNEEKVKEWEKTIEESEKKAATDLGDYVTQAAGLMTALADNSKAANDRITADQAKAYADQAAAQRAHLGQMLSDYTIAWGRMNGVSEEKIMETVGQIEKQFGKAGDFTGTTLLGMEKDIREAMTNGGTAVDGLSTKLGNATDAAVDLKIKADALEKKYVMELVENLKEGKIDAEEFRHELEKVPRRVDTEVHTNFTYSGERPTQGPGGGPRASGGPVMGGTAYLVGEKGPELFVPHTSGSIINAQKTRSMARAEGGGPITDPVAYFGALGASAADAFASSFFDHTGQIDSAVSNLVEDAGDKIDTFSDNAADQMGSAFAEGVEKWADRMMSLIEDIGRQMEEQIGAQLEGGGGGGGSLGGGGTLGTGGGTIPTPTPMGLRASGGSVFGGRGYMVGERGPEMFFPRSSGSIMNAWDTRSILNSLSQPRIVAPTIVQPTVVMVQPANTQNYYGQVGNNYTDSRSYRGGGAGGNDRMDTSLYGSRG